MHRYSFQHCDVCDRLFAQQDLTRVHFDDDDANLLMCKTCHEDYLKEAEDERR